ncbi:Fic family protein [Neisseria animaloris]|uniref:Fic family protein n=1 Tax=Neisseria animaloris TaxID=326522 RepID=UPI000A19ACEE|nr:Fic family protein [Neisseria animaloris]OSI08660.1 cell filamentation protein Fic [Neisseria animaloris]VEH87393.1 Fic family protein [Neisseria animaloris]
MNHTAIDLSNAVQYHYNRFPPQEIQLQQFFDEIIAAVSALSRYDQMLKTLHNSEILLAPLRSREAVISSRIEGTISTLDEILRYDAEAEIDQINQEIRQDTIETLLYQRTLKAAQHALTEGQPLSPAMLRTMHQGLLSFGRGAQKAPGQFKTEQNYIGRHRSRRIDFVPIAPEHLQSGLDRLFDYINQDTGHHPIIKTAFAHIEFEALHPFKDGNGRIGRMLIPLLLWQMGQISAPHFYISHFFEEHKDEYIERMRAVSQENDWSGWCAFFCRAVSEQAQQNLCIAEEITALYDNMKTNLTEILSSKWTVVILDALFTQPVFKATRFAVGSNIPKPTLQKQINILLEKGIIQTVEEASGRRAALYSFEPLLQLVRI